MHPDRGLQLVNLAYERLLRSPVSQEFFSVLSVIMRADGSEELQDIQSSFTHQIIDLELCGRIQSGTSSLESDQLYHLFKAAQAYVDTKLAKQTNNIYNFGLNCIICLENITYSAIRADESRSESYYKAFHLQVNDFYHLNFDHYCELDLVPFVPSAKLMDMTHSYLLTRSTAILDGICGELIQLRSPIADQLLTHLVKYVDHPQGCLVIDLLRGKYALNRVIGE